MAADSALAELQEPHRIALGAKLGLPIWQGAASVAFLAPFAPTRAKIQGKNGRRTHGFTGKRAYSGALGELENAQTQALNAR